MTPTTERRITMFCVIRRQGIRPRGERYAELAGVAELVRRARLKIGWPSGRAGSSPAPGIALALQLGPARGQRGPVEPFCGVERPLGALRRLAAEDPGRPPFARDPDEPQPVVIQSQGAFRVQVQIDR